jgi:hypothetical protein
LWRILSLCWIWRTQPQERRICSWMIKLLMWSIKHLILRSSNLSKTWRWHISYYDLGTKKGPTSVATSPTFLDRPIGRADGPDRAITGLFTKEPSNSGTIEPAVQPPLSAFLSKKPSTFFEIDLQYRPFNRVACHPLHGP